MCKYWGLKVAGGFKELRQIEIKKLMEQRGMTVAELALKLGVSQTVIRKDLEEIG